MSVVSGPSVSGFDLDPGDDEVVDYQLEGESDGAAGDQVGFSAWHRPGRRPGEGSATTGVVVANPVTVTAVTPNHDQVDGGNSVTVTGTGFETAYGDDLVTGVEFVPQNGGSTLMGTDVDVTSQTSLTVTEPNAQSDVSPIGTMVTDVEVQTATQTSYENAPNNEIHVQMQPDQEADGRVMGLRRLFQQSRSDGLVRGWRPDARWAVADPGVRFDRRLLRWWGCWELGLLDRFVHHVRQRRGDGDLQLLHRRLDLALSGAPQSVDRSRPRGLR